jgi:hypothetical protein
MRSNVMIESNTKRDELIQFYCLLIDQKYLIITIIININTIKNKT